MSSVFDALVRPDFASGLHGHTLTQTAEFGDNGPFSEYAVASNSCAGLYDGLIEILAHANTDC